MSTPSPAGPSTPQEQPNKWLPANPFDMPETRQFIAQKIALGDISQDDVDIMERGYNWMIYTPPVTAVSFTFLIWQLMKKQYPQPRMITRLFWGGLSAGAGGFLGFGAAGVAAAMEVEDKMEDVERKSLVFEEITDHSRAIHEARIAALLPPAPPEPVLTPAARQATTRGSSRLPKDFEFPPERVQDLKVGKERVKEETQSTWGYLKSWVSWK